MDSKRQFLPELPVTALHEEDGFKLATVKNWGWNSWIYHWHADKERWFTCGCLSNGVCGLCAAKIPDKIHGLWKLHNWDEIGLMK